MSETFVKILVKDDRLGCITPKVKFQVFKGGQNVTCQPYKAISETNAQHTYTVTVPSLETIISREVLWQSTVTLRMRVVDDVIRESGPEVLLGDGVLVSGALPSQPL